MRSLTEGWKVKKKITRRTTGARGCYQVSSINDPVLISRKYHPLPNIKNQISSIKYHINYQ